MGVELCYFDLHYRCFPKVPSPCLIIPPSSGFTLAHRGTAILFLLRRSFALSVWSFEPAFALLWFWLFSRVVLAVWELTCEKYRLSYTRAYGDCYINYLDFRVRINSWSLLWLWRSLKYKLIFSKLHFWSTRWGGSPEGSLQLFFF